MTIADDLRAARAEPTLRFIYRNWRGEIAERAVTPIRVWFGKTDWHPVEQWFIEAVDAENGNHRDFAVSEILTFEPERSRRAIPSAAPPPPAGMVLDEIAAERERQKSVEGWTAEHDDEHSDGQMATAASCYAAYSAASMSLHEVQSHWPWGQKWWKPTTPRRDLIKAAALIVAEIERLDRAAAPGQPAQADTIAVPRADLALLVSYAQRFAVDDVLAAAERAGRLLDADVDAGPAATASGGGK